MRMNVIKRQGKQKKLKLRKPERSIRNTALDLLSRREHTRLELSRKLKAKKFSSSEIDELLSLLKSEGLQSDARYTESYVYLRRQRGFGPMKIKLELQERGVSTHLIDTHVDADSQAWLNTARREYVKKFGDQTAESLKEKAKRVRFLQSRGFTSDIIRKTLVTYLAR